VHITDVGALLRACSNCVGARVGVGVWVVCVFVGGLTEGVL